MKEFRIKNRTIGKGHPAYIIAEMSGNHAGSIERAKEIIHAAKESGADCIKIQTYTPDTITMDCDNEYFQIEQGTWNGENLYQLYGKAYTPWEWQKELKEEADKVGIDFFSTPFDKTSVDFLEEIGMEFYKIASFELVDLPLIKYVAEKGKPIILSTGMSTLAEIQEDDAMTVWLESAAAYYKLCDHDHARDLPVPLPDGSAARDLLPLLVMLPSVDAAYDIYRKRGFSHEEAVAFLGCIRLNIYIGESRILGRPAITT